MIFLIPMILMICSSNDDPDVTWANGNDDHWNLDDLLKLWVWG